MLICRKKTNKKLETTVIQMLGIPINPTSIHKHIYVWGIIAGKKKDIYVLICYRIFQQSTKKLGWKCVGVYKSMNGKPELQQKICHKKTSFFCVKRLLKKNSIPLKSYYNQSVNYIQTSTTCACITYIKIIYPYIICHLLLTSHVTILVWL